MITLTITLTGPDAGQVAEELRMDLEDYRDSGNHDFTYEVEEA